jgi:hypothetical protein
MNAALDAAIAASCPPWCTDPSHHRFPAEEPGGVVAVSHRAALFESEGRAIDLLRWIEFADDGSIVDDATTLFVSGFGDATVYEGDEAGKVAAAMATVGAALAGGTA